jgi:hypothetical protein
MTRSAQPLRLDPQAAGELLHKYNLAATEVDYATRYRKEFDRQLKQLIGSEATRMLHKSTESALLLADMIKEAA